MVIKDGIKEVKTGTTVFAWLQDGGIVIGLLQSQGEMIVGQSIQYFYHILIGGGRTIEFYQNELMLMAEYNYDQGEEEENPEPKENHAGMTTIDSFYKGLYSNKERLYGSR